jgi:hypothetical protein
MLILPHTNIRKPIQQLEKRMTEKIYKKAILQPFLRVFNQQRTSLNSAQSAFPQLHLPRMKMKMMQMESMNSMYHLENQVDK